MRVDGYHRTVDLMSTTACVDLEAQFLLLRRSMFVVSGYEAKVAIRASRMANSPTKQRVCGWRESSKVVLSARGRAGRTSGAV